MNPLAIFSGPYALLAKWGVIGALLVAFGGWAWVKGDEHGTEKLTAYIGKQAVETVRIGAARVVIVKEIETKYVDRVRVIYQRGATIEREVKVYVTQVDDAGCVVPVGFVREHNAAWAGAPAGPPAESDRGPSGLALSSVAEADAGNATTCRILKEQRDGLIVLYRRLQAVR